MESCTLGSLDEELDLDRERELEDELEDEDEEECDLLLEPALGPEVERVDRLSPSTWACAEGICSGEARDGVLAAGRPSPSSGSGAEGGGFRPPGASWLPWARGGEGLSVTPSPTGDGAERVSGHGAPPAAGEGAGCLSVVWGRDWDFS
eukprot:g15210.t1